MDVYGGLRSPDVELLLDLLAETEGVASAVRILTLLDQEFHLAWRTHRLQQANEIGCTHADITFDSAPVAEHLRQRAAARVMSVKQGVSYDKCPKVNFKVNFLESYSWQL